jgi:L-amino acid N-acyltransferase YncA
MSYQPYQIQLLGASELDAVTDFCNQELIRQETTFGRIPLMAEFYCRELLEQHTGGYESLVYKDDNNKILALAGLIRHTDRVVYTDIAEIVILVRQNLRAGGLGKLMLSKLMVLAEQKHFSSLLILLPENPGWLAQWFGRYGFLQKAIIPKLLGKGEQKQNLIAMQKMLSKANTEVKA